MGDVIPFRRADGWQEFTCSECGDVVFRLDVGAGCEIPVCRLCQFIGEHPQLTAAWKAAIRGFDPPHGKQPLRCEEVKPNG